MLKTTRKSKLKLISLLSLALSIILMLPITSLAAEESQEENQIYYDYINDCYFTTPFVIENGKTKELTFDEYMENVIQSKEILENKQIENKQNPQSLNDKNSALSFSPSALVTTNFLKAGEANVMRYDLAKRVSPYVVATYVDTEISITDSASVSSSYSSEISLSPSMKSMIESSFTIGYSRSKEYSKSFGTAGVVPVGYRGYVRFTPNMANIWGSIKETVYWDTGGYSEYFYGVDAYYPKKVGDFADGSYVIILDKV